MYIHNCARKKKLEQIFEELKKIFTEGGDIPDARVRVLLDEIAPYAEQSYVELDSSISNTGSTLLHNAVWYNKPHLVQWLLDAGCSPNKPNMKGSTPMHFAVCFRSQFQSERI